MTNEQVFVAIGIPFAVNVLLILFMINSNNNARIKSLESRITALQATLTGRLQYDSWRKL